MARKLKNRLRRYKQKIAGSSNDPCVLCGAKATSIDHIYPIVKGGTVNDIHNWAPMCHNCNQLKGEKSILMAIYKNE